jgi:LmbE family N-acetylglucosaminyl deacetylase
MTTKNPRVVLSIHAHPDDQEFSVAGTLAAWRQAGAAVYSIIITSGDAGSNDPQYDEKYKPELAKIREKEQRAAGEIIGVNETIFLRYPDGTLQPTLELRRDLTRLIRHYKPDAVVTGDPTVRFSGNYINHPDHRVAADVAIDAVFPSAGTRLIFPELLHQGYPPHNVKYLYIHTNEKSDTWVDISATIDTKVQALRMHKTQLGDWDPDKMIHEWASATGKEHGMAYAEAYRRIVLIEEDEDQVAS